MASRALPKRVWFSAFATAALVVALGYWVWERPDLPDLNKKTGAQISSGAPLRDAPGFSLPDDRGVMHRLEELKGQVVILHFWATWCAPCLDEIPQWVELARKFEGRPVAWVAISLDRSWSDAHRYLKPDQLPPNLLSLLDAPNATPEKFGSYQFPETYLITPDQKILSKWVGPQPWDAQRMREAIEKVVELTIPRS